MEVAINEVNYEGSISNTFIVTERETVLSVPNALIDIEIYPNPASSVLSIRAKGGTKVELVYMRGITRFDEDLQSTALKIRVSDLSRGVYLLRLTDPQTRATIQRQIILLD